MLENTLASIRRARSLVAQVKQSGNTAGLREVASLVASLPSLVASESRVAVPSQGSSVASTQQVPRIVAKNVDIDEEANNSDGQGIELAMKSSSLKRIANGMFRGVSERLLPSFSRLRTNLQRAHLNILPSTYLSLLFFFMMISFFLTIGVYGVLLYIDVSYWTYVWLIIVVPLFVGFSWYYYPSLEADSAQKIISYELPFATIHMAAIAGSNISPLKMFEIIASSKEYVHIGSELRKVLVLVRVYGYDIVTSLKEVASRTANGKFAELLGGIASNIGSGGDLKLYLSKKSENYLLDYKLERRRYIDLASTFMDIYISILIAAPMVLMLMFIVMNVAGLGFAGVSLQFLLFMSVFLIIIVNILFLVTVHLKQPRT